MQTTLVDMDALREIVCINLGNSRLDDYFCAIKFKIVLDYPNGMDHPQSNTRIKRRNVLAPNHGSPRESMTLWKKDDDISLFLC